VIVKMHNRVFGASAPVKVLLLVTRFSFWPSSHNLSVCCGDIVGGAVHQGELRQV